MSLYPDDILNTQFATEAQKQKRLTELTIWASRFVQYQAIIFSEDIVPNKDKLSLVNSNYWETLEGYVRPRLIPNNRECRVDRHKIASLTELSICFFEPLELPDPEKKTDINARFAYTAGSTIIGNWDEEKITDLTVSKSFLREHLVLLREVRRDKNLPIFSNAATWYLIELLCEERRARELSTL